MKTFSSVLRFGVSGLRRKRIENVPNRIENVEGKKYENAKNVFYVFVGRPGKTTKTLKTFPKRIENVPGKQKTH